MNGHDPMTMMMAVELSNNVLNYSMFAACRPSSLIVMVLRVADVRDGQLLIVSHASPYFNAISCVSRLSSINPVHLNTYCGIGYDRVPRVWRYSTPL